MVKTELKTSEKQRTAWKRIGVTGGRFAWFVGGVIVASIIGYTVNAVLTHIWPITFGHLIIPNLTFIVVAIIITILLSILCFFLGAYLVVWFIGKMIVGFLENLANWAKKAEQSKSAEEKVGSREAPAKIEKSTR